MSGWPNHEEMFRQFPNGIDKGVKVYHSQAFGEGVTSSAIRSRDQKRVMVKWEFPVYIGRSTPETRGLPGESRFGRGKFAAVNPNILKFFTPHCEAKKLPEPAAQPSGAAAPAPAPAPASEAKVRQLMEMGYTKENSVAALGATGGNIEGAIEHLLQAEERGASSAAAARAAPAAVPQLREAAGAPGPFRAQTSDELHLIFTGVNALQGKIDIKRQELDSLEARHAEMVGSGLAKTDQKMIDMVKGITAMRKELDTMRDEIKQKLPKWEFSEDGGRTWKMYSDQIQDSLVKAFLAGEKQFELPNAGGLIVFNTMIHHRSGSEQEVSASGRGGGNKRKKESKKTTKKKTRKKTKKSKTKKKKSSKRRSSKRKSSKRKQKKRKTSPSLSYFTSLE